MKAGDISIDLTINDTDFSVKLKNGGQLLSQFTRQLDNSARSAKVVENHFSSLSTRFRHFMIMVASTRFALLDINQVFLSLPRAIIQSSAEIERMTKLLEGLSTEVDKTADALKSKRFIFETALSAPFDVKALTDAFVKLKSGGIDPMNGSMKAIVDSVAKFGGTSDHLHRAAIALQQMSGKGVISMEELRQQLGEAVPNAMALMAEGTAMSMAQLAKTVSKGVVEANGALERMFIAMRIQNDGAAKALMTTWTGMFEQLKTKWELLKVDMGGDGQKGGMFDSAKEQLQRVLDAFDTDTVRQVMLDISYVFVQVAKAAVATVETIGKFYNEIKVAGLVILQIFAGYKLFNLLRDMEKGVAKMFTNTVAHQRAAGEAFVRNEREKHEKAVAEAQKGLARAEHALNRHQQRIQAMENRQTRMNTRAADLLREAHAMERQARAIDQRTEAGRFMSRQLTQEAAARRQQASAAGAAAGALATERNALVSQTPALQRSVIDHERLAAAQFRVAAGARAVAATRTMLMGFWTAMGGWVGIATGALVIGVMKLVEWANAAEHAAERAENAWRGLSSLDAQKKAQADLQETEEKIRRAESMLANDAARGGGWLSDRAGIEERLAEDKKRREELQKELTQHDINLAKSEQDRYANQVKRLTEQTAAKEAKAYIQAQEYWNRWKREEQQKIQDSGMSRKDKEAADKRVRDQAAEMIRAVKGGQLDTELRVLNRQKKELEDALNWFGDGKEADKQRAALAEIEKVIADREQFKQQLGKYGTETPLLTPEGDDPNSPQKKLESWLNRVQDKLATINGELNKKGSGDIAKLMQDLQQLDIPQSQKDKLRGVWEGLLLSKEDELEFSRAFDSLNKSVTSGVEGLDEQLSGGTSAIGKLRLELAKLYMMDGANFDALDELGRKVDDFEKKTSQLKLRDLMMNMGQATESIRAGLSDNRADDAFASYSKDLNKMAEEIFKAKLGTQELQQAQELYAQFVTARYNRLQRDLETPMQKLGREWANTTKQMEQASVQVAERSMDALQEFFTTGKVDAAAFAEDILKSFLRIQMNTMYGGVVQNASDAFTKFMGNIIGPQSGAGANPAADAAANGLGQVTEASGIVSKAMDSLANTSIGQLVTGFLETIGITKLKTGAETTQVMALNNLTGAAYAAAAALQSVGTSGGASTGSKLLSVAGQMAMAYFTGGTSTAVSAGAQTIGTGYGQLGSGTSFMNSTNPYAFANGGIMTEFGAVALRKYAQGGVANRPQLALFGEGSKPEAYVPLPDGRTIPVTMEGGPVGAQAGNVTVNVYNNASGTEAKANQSQDANGNLTIDVIVDQIEGKMSQNIARGRSPVGQVLERQYGLNRANGAMR